MRRITAPQMFRRPVALAVVAAALMCVPAAAQETIEPVADSTLTHFAAVFMQVQEAREAFQAELGRTHDAGGHTRLRAEFAETMERILEEAEMTREDFDRMTTLVSHDESHRLRFEAILAELEESGNDGSG